MTIRARLHWDGDKLDKQAHRGAVKGLTDATEHILGVSNSRVPIEEHILEASGTPSVDEGDLIGAVSYDTVYAARQHEELTWRHAPGRQAKYLESAFIDEAGTARALIAAAIRRAMRD